MVKQYELLKPDGDCVNKVRLAFAKAHANEMWQADTLYGPFVKITGAAKGKIERFFRTVRDQFLARDLDLSSLEALNRQFTQWVEEHYNAQLHSILGMSPLDRYALDRKWVRFLPPNEANDELFFVEEEHHVRADSPRRQHVLVQIASV